MALNQRVVGSNPSASTILSNPNKLVKGIKTGLSCRPHAGNRPPNAALAQLVEHIIRNDGVTCSSHVSGTIFFDSTP